MHEDDVALDPERKAFTDTLTLPEVATLALSHGMNPTAWEFAWAYWRDLKETEKGGLHLLNTTIIPSSVGLSRWQLVPIPSYIAPSVVRILMRSACVHADEGCWDIPYPQSHLGHQGTVDYVRAELRTWDGYVKLDRTPWDGQGVGVCIQLNGRLPEGQILTAEEMRAIGASWRLLYMA